MQRLRSALAAEAHRGLPSTSSGRLRFQLLDVGGHRAVDGDLPWLHCLGNFTHEFDAQQAVVERGARDLNVIGQTELALERTRGDAAVEVFALCFSLAAFDRQHVLFGGQPDIGWTEPRESQRYLVAVFAEAFEVIGRIGIIVGALGGINEVKQAIKTNGRSPQGSKIVSSHSQILQLSKMGTSRPRTPPAPVLTGPETGRPTAICGIQKTRKKRDGFKSRPNNF